MASQQHKILSHVLKKNKFQLLGGNIGAYNKFEDKKKYCYN